MTELERIAYARAAEAVFSNVDEFGGGYQAYAYLSECLETGREPEDLDVWDLYEFCDWSYIHDCIVCEGDTHLSWVSHILTLAQRGLTQSATDGTLPADVSAIDLQAMVEAGDAGREP